MLPYGLAIAVGLTSLVLFLTAFLMPKIHRQDDFLWSGVGLFYALVLWFCAAKIHGVLLLGQSAVVILLSSYTWQVISLRQAIANPEEPSLAESFSITGFFGNLLNLSPDSSSSETSVSQEIPASDDKNDNIPEEKASEIVLDKKEEVPVVVDGSPSNAETTESLTSTISQPTATEDSTSNLEESSSSIETQLDDLVDLETATATEDSTSNLEESSSSIETQLDDLVDLETATATEDSTSNLEESSSSIETQLDDLVDLETATATEDSTSNLEESSSSIETQLDDLVDL
nr:Ycf66 family protein [Xenococcaceae cyanobacterium MO_167.B27]